MDFDISLPLHEDVVLLVEDQPWSQLFDYEGPTFRCHPCFTTGHLTLACSLLRRKCAATWWNNANDDLLTVPTFSSSMDASSQASDEHLALGTNLVCFEVLVDVFPPMRDLLWIVIVVHLVVRLFPPHVLMVFPWGSLMFPLLVGIQMIVSLGLSFVGVKVPPLLLPFIILETCWISLLYRVETLISCYFLVPCSDQKHYWSFVWFF